MTAISRRVALASLLLGAGACTDTAPGDRPLTIATGGVGGVYNTLGEAFAAVLRRNWGIRVTVVRTAASVENLHMVATGRADLGFASIDSVQLAVAGQPPFTGRQPISTLGLLYDDYLQAVTPAGDPVRRLGDMASAAVSVGAPESGTELIALRLLRSAGVSPVRLFRLALAESVEALLAGQISGFFFSGGLPTPAIANLARSRPIRLLPLGTFEPALSAEYGGVYITRTIPAKTYGLGANVSTIGVHNLLINNTGMDPERAYRLTRLLFRSQAELVAAHGEASHLHVRTAIFTSPVPLHPGAVRYYREVKFGVA